MELVQPMSFQVLFDFETALAEYTGAPYVVLTDGCTHAIELCLRYEQVAKLSLPTHTYLSILQLMRQLNITYELVECDWFDQGEYQFGNTRIWDSARRLAPGMYRAGQIQCLSFGNGKPLQLGKVGAVLTDDLAVYQTLSQMRSDGRDLRVHPWSDQQQFHQGYHYCPTLEDCSRGIQMLKSVTEFVTKIPYPDLRYIHIS